MMKAALLAAFAGVCAAQNLGSCAQLCLDNMARVAQTDFGCATGDYSCLCNKSNWAYGVRDCTRQACGSGESAQAIAFAAKQCSAVDGVASASSAASSRTPTALPTPPPVATGAPISIQPSSRPVSASPSGFVTLPPPLQVLTSTSVGTSAASGATSSVMSSAASSISSSVSSPGPVAQQSKGLSTGSKAGIGVAIPIIFILIAGLVFALWRRRKRTPQTTEHNRTTPHSGLMVPAYEDTHNPTKPELDSTAIAMQPELDSTTRNMSPPPTYTHHQPPVTRNIFAHEMPIPGASPAPQRPELGATHGAPADVGPAIVVPTPYREDGSRIEQLRAQRAALAREREHKEEIERIRAEEGRLDREIAELESRGY